MTEAVAPGAAQDITNTAALSAPQEVFDEIAKPSALPAEAKACLAAIGIEGGPVGFRALFGGGTWTGSLAQFPPKSEWPGAPIPNDAQGRVSTAFGFAQFLRATDELISGLLKPPLPDVSPQSQIRKAWVLAVRDFERNSGGGDLLEALRAGRIDDDVHQYLASTWPLGCDANFPVRYRAALPRFQAIAPPSDQTIEIPLGLAVSYPIKAWTKKHEIPVPGDAVVVEDLSVCRPEIVGDRITFQSAALGQTRASGADFSAPILVYKPTPDHIEVDLTKPTFSQTAGAMLARLPLLAGAGAVALMLLARPAGLPEPARLFFAATNEVAKSDVPPPPPLSSELGMISKGDNAETFCFGPDRGFPITICRH